MTKIETAELAELGMTSEQLQERREKLAATLNQSAAQIVANTPVPTSVDRGPGAPEKQRKPRSDKGTQRPVKIPAAAPINPTGITVEDAVELRVLCDKLLDYTDRLTATRAAFAYTRERYDELLDSITRR
jgi:hypothetical protein